MCSEKSNGQSDIITLINKYDICIPIIQRDYAHGRDDTKTREIRKTLISDLIACLSSDDDEKKIDFNFVYGTVSNGVFYPVDGQQRLTTLYLVSWYLAVRCGGGTLNKFLYRENDQQKAKSFRYEIRSSANEFFRQLREVKEGDELHKIVNDSPKGSLKRNLKNSTWFRHNWINDPTVQSALTFLDDLHKELKDSKNPGRLYNNLKRITFQLNAEDNNENADANAAKGYLRMNARGKPLDDFENLKAMLDSIDNNLKKFNMKAFNLACRYDTIYIDKLFMEESKENPGTVLAQKAKNINSKSLIFFKNLYKLRRMVFGDGKKGSLSDVEFINKFHTASREDNKPYIFTNYIQMLVRVLNLYRFWDGEGCPEAKKTLDKLFKDSCDLSAAAPLVLCAMYRDAINEENAKEIAEECERMLYIVENLKEVIGGNRRLKIINDLAKKSSGSGIFPYFKNTCLGELFKVTWCEDDPEKQAIVREQQIKATIILEHKDKYNYYRFKELEDRDSRRRVQYLLYIAGYYDEKNTNEEDKFTRLTKYFKIAENYFHKNETALTWKKLWAIAYYIDQKFLTTSTAEIDEAKAAEIDKNCGGYEPWKYQFYYWNGPGGPEPESAEKKRLDRIKLIYQNISVLVSNTSASDSGETLDRIIENGKNCWLKYAVMYAGKKDMESFASGLLDYKLKFAEGEGGGAYFADPDKTGNYYTGEFKWNYIPFFSDDEFMQRPLSRLYFDMEVMKHKKGGNFGIYPNNRYRQSKTFSYAPGSEGYSGNKTLNITLILRAAVRPVVAGSDIEKCICVGSGPAVTVYRRTGSYKYEHIKFELTDKIKALSSLEKKFKPINECDGELRKTVLEQREAWYRNGNSITLLSVLPERKFDLIGDRRSTDYQCMVYFEKTSNCSGTTS